jgi:hypothetical protein
MKTNQKRPAVFTRLAVALLLLLVVGVLATLATPFRTVPAEAATNSTVNFQARLMSNAGSIVPDGQYNVEFKIYNVLTSTGSSQGSCTGDAACLWTETRVTSDKVSVANGYLTVDLGSVTALPTNIDWSQNLYLGMRIGGVGAASWDPEMSPRLHLTAVPYAFTAGKLQGLSNSNAVSLSFATNFGQPSAITLPDPGGASATVCYQNAAAACGYAASTGGSAYIQNQIAGAQTSSNFWISNTGVADVSFQTPLLDTPAGTTTLNIGTTNATAGISIKQSTSIVAGKTFNVFGDTTLVPTGGSTNAFRVQNSSSQNVLRVDSTNSAVLLGQASRAGSLFISDGGASGNSLVLASSGMQTSGASRTITLNGASLTAGRTYTLPDANGTFCMQSSTSCNFAPTTAGTGYIQNTTTVQTATYAIRSGAIGNIAAVIQGASGQTADMLRLQTWNGSTATSVAVINNVGALALSGTGTNVFTTPVGTSVNTKISIAPYAVGASAQIVSVGLTSGADTTSNGIAVYDARSSAHRASIAVYSPNESETIGLSWNGSNTNAYLQTLSHTAGTATAGLILQSGDVAGGTGNSGDVTLQSGTTAGATGQLTGSISIKSGTTTNTNGSTGSITIDSGAKTGSGTAGGVSIGNTNAPTVVIGNTSSTTTVNGTLGVGAVPTRKLDVYINDSVTTAAMARLLQAGAGDAALELNNSVRGYYIGVDTSDSSKFKISSSTANAATISVGYDSEGIGSPDSGNSALLNATQITSSSTAGTANSVSVFFANVTSQNVKMGLYTDNGSDQPGSLVASSSEVAAANGWNTLPISGSISATTKYWVVFRISDNAVQYGHTNGVGKICFAAVAYASAWPASFTPQGTCPITEHYTVYLTYTPSGAVDNFAASLFTLTDTGAVTFQNSTNSTAALRIQNAAATSTIFNADTANNRVGINNAAPTYTLDVAGELRVVGSSTSSSTLQIQGAASATVPTAIIKGGSSPGGSADILQIQTSSATVAYFDNTGKFNTTKDININNPTSTTAFTVQGASSTFATINPNDGKFYIGDPTQCSGRFCVYQSLTGTGGSSYTNAYNLMDTNVTTASTFISQDIIINDTTSSGLALAHTLRGIRIDLSGTTNTEASLNPLLIKIPTTTSTSTYGGNAMQVQNGSTNIFRITNVGAATFQTTSATSSAFQVLNTSGNNILQASSNGNYVAVGNITTTGGAGVAGDLRLADGSVTGRYMSIVTATLASASQIITLPDETGTVCTNNASSTACSGKFIFNATAQQSSSNFYISGTGKATAALQAASLDAISGGLSVGNTNATSITVGNTSSDNLTTVKGYAKFAPSATNTTTSFQITTVGNAVVFNADTFNSRVGVGTAAPSEALTVNGNFNIRDADTPTKQYRFRTTGFGLDLEAAGASLYMSGWTNGDFTGTQQTWLIGSGAVLTVGNGSGGSGGTNPTILVLDNKTSGTSDPGGTNGAMYYNTALKAFRCYEDGVWHYCNDRRSMAWGYNIEEDFLGTDDGAFTFGELGWNETNSGTGSDSWRTGAQDNRPGIIEQDTGTTTTGRSALYLGYASVDPTADTISITGGETIEFAFNLFQLSTAGQEFDSRIGLCDVVSGDCVDGIYFEYDRNSSTNWRIATSSNSSRTKTNTSTAVATGWTRFKIVVNSNATSITYYINDTSVGTIAATIPTTSARQTCPMFQIVKSAGSSIASQFIDYFAMYNSFTTPR